MTVEEINELIKKSKDFLDTNILKLNYSESQYEKDLENYVKWRIKKDRLIRNQNK